MTLIIILIAIGFILEVIGFLFLTRYTRTAKEDEYFYWDCQKFDDDYVAYLFHDEKSNQPTMIKFSFLKYWNQNKNYSIITILVGLFIQAATSAWQILVNTNF